MTYQEFNKSLKEGRIGKLYLLYGIDEYMKDYYIKSIRNALLGDNDFNYFKIDSRINARDLSDLCDEMPIFGQKKMIVVKNSDFFSGMGTANLDLDFLSDLPEFTCLVFREDNVDKRSKSYKMLEKHGIVIECVRQNETMIGKILTKAAMQQNRRITMDAINLMISGLGDDLVALLNELDKLIKYTDEGDVITDKHVRKVCGLSTSQRIFDLTDALSLKDTGRAMASLRVLLDNNESSQFIIVMVARQFLQLYDTKCIVENGGSVRDVVAVLGVRDFVARKLVEQCRRFTKKELKDSFENCLKMDEDIKNGLIKDETALELIVAGTSSGK